MKEESGGGLSEVIKKVLTAGIGAAFLTEGTLRHILKDVKLPKEILNGFLEGAEKTKREFFQNISKEIVNRITEEIQPKELIHELGKNHELEIKVQVKLKEIDSELPAVN